jgi:hypothetical protein
LPEHGKPVNQSVTPPASLFELSGFILSDHPHNLEEAFVAVSPSCIVGQGQAPLAPAATHEPARACRAALIAPPHCFYLLALERSAAR